MFFKRKIWNDGAPFEDFMGRDGAPPVARRHLAYGGGKGGSGGTTYQTQKTEIPPEVRARYDAINARAEQVAQQPFTPYGGQFVAPLTATQQQGIQQIGQAGQSYQPYQQAATTALTGGAEAGLPFYGQAAGNIAQAQGAGQPYTGLATQAGLAGTQAIAPQALNIGAYQNPYIQSVVDPTMAALRQQQQMEQSQLMGQQAMRGAFGGDRGSIAAANLARQQNLASAQTEAGLRSQGFQQAQQTAQQQQGVGLGAAQANRAALQQFSPQALAIGQQAFQQPMATAQAQQQLGQGLLGYGQNVAQGLSGLGQQGAQLGLATGQAQLGAGTLEQQTQQQLNSAFYNQFQQQQGYPFQVAQFLANIGMGTGPLYGSTTTGVTGQPTPFFSDERVKEDITEIGRTHDGQKIIKFRYKGEPKGTSHIGLSAQDVEKHHPEAVSETAGGIKAVDYDAATKQAERAYGGGLMPSSEGGAVHPSMAGLGFAAGGTPRPAFAGAGAVTPGVDARSQQILEMLANPGAGTLPYNTAGKSLPKGQQQAWAVGRPPQREQILGSGVQLKAPAQRPTGLSEVMGDVKGAVDTVETSEKAYKLGEKAYDWAKEQAVGAPARPAVPAAGNTPAQPATPATSGNLGLGHGGKWGAPAPTQTSAAPPQAPGLGATASLEELPREEAVVARGGRIGYATNGAVNDDGLPGSSVAEDETPAIPGGGDDTPLGQLTKKQITPAKLPTHTLGGGGGGGSGGGGGAMGDVKNGLGAASSAVNIASSLSKMFAAHGGRIGYDEGGDVMTPPDLPVHKLDMSDSASGSKKDTTAKDALGLAGTFANFIPGVGPAIGAGLKVASMFAKDGGRIGYATDGRVDPAMMADAKRRIAGIESGGRYDALGPMVGGDRAHGKYQVMGANLPSWTQEALGRRMTPAEFLKSPEAQERVFEHHFGKYLGQHGNLADAASMWHSGVPLSEARRQGRRDVNMSTEDYVRKIMGGAPPAEAHMRAEMPEPRHAGLAPKISVDDEEPMGLVPDDDENFEMPDRFNRFASGGLVPRNGYPTGGEVIDPDKVDPTNPAQVALLKAQIQRGSPPAPAPQSTPTPPPGGDASADLQRTKDDLDLVGHNRPAAGVAPPPQSTPDPERDFFDRAGDWYGRNQNWVLPLAGGIGKMLASRSPYFLNAAGEGLAEAAPLALGASQKQQGLDINMMDRLGKQVGVLASDIALRGGPGMSPELDKAQQAAMARYYRLSGVNYTPELMDPAKVRAQMAASPFARLREMDNPEGLYRSAQTPGLSGEQKQAYMDRAVQATQRLLSQGFGVAADGSKVEFPDIHEAFRASEYGRALVQAAAQTAGSGMPGGANFNANLEINIKQAEQDVSDAMAANRGNLQAGAVRQAEQRLADLKKQKQQALPPSVPRAYGGRTGYQTAGAVVDMTEAQPAEDIQLAQAMPPAPPAATARPMPHLPPTPSRAPEAKPIPSVPIPSGEGLPTKYPETAGEFREYYRQTLNKIPAAESEKYLKRAEDLEREAIATGKLPTNTGVQVAPGAVETKNTLDNATYNTKWLQDQSEAQQKRAFVQNGLDVLTDALTHVNTNPLAPFTGKVAEYMRALHFNVGNAAERAAAVQEIAKQVAQQAQSAGTDLGRIMSTEGSVEATKNPMANRAIMAQAYAKLDYDRARYEYFMKELDRDRSTDPARLQKDFERSFPIDRAYDMRFNQLALPGATPLTESGALDWPSLKPGASYLITPKEWYQMSGGEKIGQPKRMRVVVTRDGKKEMVD